MFFYVIFSSFQDQIMRKYLEDWIYLFKKQKLRNYAKKGKNEENTQKPSYHDGEHRPTMSRD
jgi:hypothetical protein